MGLETQTSETGDIDLVYQRFRKQASQSKMRKHSAMIGIAIADEIKTSAVDLAYQHPGIMELHRIETRVPCSREKSVTIPGTERTSLINPGRHMTTQTRIEQPATIEIGGIIPAATKPTGTRP